jgi:thioester reductase-like protein
MMGIERPDTVFLTGGTGQVGAALLPRLLCGPNQRVLALVRARDPGHLERRRQELGALLPDDDARSRLRVIQGDIGREDLGLSLADRDAVEAVATSILHCAASVRFDLPLEEARQENVIATGRILDLGRRLHRRGGLVRVDHVSTAYVAGDRRGRVLEGERDVGQGFRNTYERTKCEAEGEVLRAGEAGLPVTIHRPSIIVGDSRSGATRTWNVLYWPLKIYTRGWWRWFPGSPETRVDVVPVDWVADTILALRARPESLGRTFHVAAGDEAPTVESLVATVRASTHGPPLRYVDPDLYRRWVRPLLMPLRFTKNGSRVFAGGGMYLPYLRGNPLFDTGGLRSLLGEGAKAPSATAYFERIVRFAVERDFHLEAG